MSLPGRLVDVDGVSIFVHRQGKGTPLVLLHGYVKSHWYFRHIIPVLAEHHDVIALDLLGFGESDRPSPRRYAYGFAQYAKTVAGLLDRLEIERAFVLGHSMGGGVAIQLAAQAPERVSGLVLVAPACQAITVPWLVDVALLPGVGELLFQRAYLKPHFARDLRTRSYGPNFILRNEDVDFWWDRLTRPGGKAAAHAMLRCLCSLESLTPDPRIESLLVWGADDALIPIDVARAIAQRFNTELKLVAGSGHTPHEERPDQFLKLVRPFLEEMRR